MLKPVLYPDYANLNHVLAMPKDRTLSFYDDIDHITADDVLIFHGGTDIDTGLYGEVRGPMTQTPNLSRDLFEKTVYEKAVAVGAKMFGICRGAQLITALNGGRLLQHIHNHTGGFHALDEFPGVYATTCHHQAMVPAGDYKIIATHEGINEIVYYPSIHALCVQGHPEWVHPEDPFMKLIGDIIHDVKWEE